MGKSLYIAEKPSVANEFAKALKLNLQKRDGYLESDEAVVTWCVGHLVTMSYPECYDEKFKRWSFDTIPFIPEKFLYEVIPSVKKQYEIVRGQLTRPDVDVIYVCTDSGREGEYIYRLIERQANVTGKTRKRVWIDSQTEEEILRGIREAKDLSEYDNLCEAAYLRAKEDYLMGINFSRALTLKYGYPIKTFLKKDKAVVSVGRVMTCVLGMIVKREREIRNFVKTPFYRVVAVINEDGTECEGEWRVTKESKYFNSPLLYKENGFLKEESAKELMDYIYDNQSAGPYEFITDAIENKKELKNPPLLYNLAELQNECAKMFKISPDETLAIVQELYEKKMVTYPRTDARVLSTAVSKEISKNISGLRNFQPLKDAADVILAGTTYKKIASMRYVNDKQITDHYAIIPTGQGINNFNSLNETCKKVYEVIARRFLAIFMEPAVYKKASITLKRKSECFYFSFKALEKEGYLSVMKYTFIKKKEETESEDNTEEAAKLSDETLKKLCALKKGDPVSVEDLRLKEGETSPPKRYNSGSIILAMENAGQLIEDDDLRAQIKGSGIGTSATRAGILKKLIDITYLSLNKKTQILTPTLMGEMIYDVVALSLRSLLNPSLTASWELGLNMVADGEITSDEYMTKLSNFVTTKTNSVKSISNQSTLQRMFTESSKYYKVAK